MMMGQLSGPKAAGGGIMPTRPRRLNMMAGTQTQWISLLVWSSWDSPYSSNQDWADFMGSGSIWGTGVPAWAGCVVSGEAILDLGLDGCPAAPSAVEEGWRGGT